MRWGSLPLWEGKEYSCFVTDKTYPFRSPARVATHSNLRHPNIVLFMGACLQIPHLAIVTEYLPRGNLHAVWIVWIG
jgi:ubiquitin-protein ligase